MCVDILIANQPAVENKRLAASQFHLSRSLVCRCNCICGWGVSSQRRCGHLTSMIMVFFRICVDGCQGIVRVYMTNHGEFMTQRDELWYGVRQYEIVQRVQEPWFGLDRRILDQN